MSCHSPVEGGGGEVRVMWSFKIASHSSCKSWDKLNIILYTLMRRWVYRFCSFLLFFQPFCLFNAISEEREVLTLQEWDSHRACAQSCQHAQLVLLGVSQVMREPLVKYSWCGFFYWGGYTAKGGRHDVCLDHMEDHSHKLKIKIKKSS